MSLDATPVKLTKIGKVTVFQNGAVYLKGFEGENCTCRDVVALALVHTIELLTRELGATIRMPGENNVGID